MLPPHITPEADLQSEKQHLLPKLTPGAAGAAGAAGASSSPEVVPAAEDEVSPGVEGGAQPAQPAVAAGTLQAVLVPEAVQRLQHEAIPYPPVAAGASPRLLPGLEGHQGHACWGRETQRE